MMNQCKVFGCTEKHSAKGFCNLHYQRKLQGIPMEGRPRPTLRERILNKRKILQTGCWVWTGAKSGGNKAGKFKYGYIRVSGKTLRVHRVLYEIERKVFLDGLQLLHSCDNPLCINPDHLSISSQLENMHDMIKKGRDKHPVGEKNHSKLSKTDVLKIKSRSKSGDSNPKIAKDFGVCTTTIRNIVIGEKWKHIEG